MWSHIWLHIITHVFCIKLVFEFCSIFWGILCCMCPLFNERGRVCPSVGGCSLMWEGVPQSGRVCPSVRGCSPVWEGVPQYGRVCPRVEGCVPVWEGVSQCWRVCPIMGGFAPVWEGLPQCERVCPIEGGCAPVYVMCVSHLLMTDTKVDLSVCSYDCRMLRTRGKGLRG